MQTETPTGKKQSVQDQEDALLASLSNLAYSARKPTTRKVRARTRNSRFWFRLDPTKVVTEKLKESMLVKKPDPIDAEVQSRLRQYRLDAPEQLKDKISQVREFFLTEIAPRTLASSGGTIQATEVVQQLLDTEVDTGIMSRFQNMVNRAATLKLARFVAKYFGLPKECIADIIGGQPHNPDIKELMTKLNEIPSRAEVRRDMTSLLARDAQKPKVKPTRINHGH